MRKTIILLVIHFFCLCPILNAQPPCAFDQRHKYLLQTDPVYSRTIESNRRSIREYIQAHPEIRSRDRQRTMALYTIPVVVHVMHTGGAVGTIYNPTDAQIIGAIDYLNDVFAGTHAGMTAPVEGGGVVDMEIQFALAQRTPSCGATNGIDRVDASGLTNYTANGINIFNSTGCPEVTMKNLARWNTADYYNIWVVNKIDGADGTSGQFIAGFAYFPGSSSSLDGTVMLATQMAAGEKTLPHEVGHALSLYHTFEESNNSSQCPPSGPCASTGDEICDTDPVSNNNVAGVYNFSCRTGAHACAGGNNYTINTESNFMAYTNCYTLFTNDQKTRVQAAMSLPSRASLVAPGNLALTPCGTVINFAQASASRTEDITGTLSGCRRYRDYTYQMGIGSGPTATATATLTYSGTAVKGIDYDVTTNGNFASPSDELTFSSGSTTPQTFTVRVYDDGEVEPNQTAIIDFTVNNGGGDAAEGTATPTFTLTISDNDVEPVGTSTGTYSIGTAAFISTNAPFNATLQSQRGQYLYKASELAAAGMTAGDITQLQLNIQSKLSIRPFTNFSIKMAHANPEYLIDGSLSVIGGMTTVFTSASYATTAGWNVFTLSVPFAWNGSSNLAIEICYDNGTADAGDAGDQVLLYSDGGNAGQANMFYQNGINCSGSFTSVTFFANGIKPIIQLSNSVTGTAIETVATSNTSMHIDAGSNDYFYSNNGRLLMRLGSISAPLGCVSSSLEEAGTNWLTYSGGERSAKVFTVTPTTNGASANYTVALYFDNSELDGKNPATLRIAKTTAASVAAANGSNTVILTPTVTTLGSGTTIFTSSFTGFSRFFLIDASVTLPVNLLSFTGKLNDQKNTVLDWITASEENNKQFDVEISSDGSNFTLLGSVLSQGNSGSEQYYQYVHMAPQPGTSWYRLKQIDWDGQWRYSNIIQVNISNDMVRSFVYPVPAKNSITINFGMLAKRADITILSTDMKTMKQETVNGPALKKEINIQALPQGVYFIRLTTDGHTRILRFMKE